MLIGAPQSAQESAWYRQHSMMPLVEYIDRLMAWQGRAWWYLVVRSVRMSIQPPYCMLCNLIVLFALLGRGGGGGDAGGEGEKRKMAGLRGGGCVHVTCVM